MKRLIALASFALLTLTGCATIPSNGAIGFVDDVRSGITGDNLYYSPSGPLESASPDLILSGFMNAGNGPQNDYAVGREYLTSEVAPKWEPTNEVLIQQGSPTYKVNSNGYATVTVNVVATVDREGRYFEQPEGTTRVLEYQLVSVGGQWRINSAPNVTVLIAPNFRVLFHAYSLYFFDNSLTYLVPEVRWFPSRVSTGTRLMQALLQGPSDWLAGAVTNVIPKGTKLNINAVTIADGVAQVDLSANALKLAKNNRKFLKAQISLTLEQLADVDRVDISIAKAPMTVNSQISGTPRTNTATPVMLSNDRLLHASGSGAQVISRATSHLADIGAIDFAIDNSENSMAALTPSGTRRINLHAFDDESILVDGRADQLSPAYDTFGWLWTGVRAMNGSLQASTAAETVSISNGWFPEATPVDFELSPEGSRIAIVYQTGDTFRTYVHSLVRNNIGQPIKLGAPIGVSAANGATDVAWASMTSIAAIVPNQIGGTTPWLITIGGAQYALRATDSASRIVVSSTGNVYVLLESGEVVTLSGAKWTNVATGVLAIHLNGN